MFTDRELLEIDESNNDQDQLFIKKTFTLPEDFNYFDVISYMKDMEKLSSLVSQVYD